MDTKRLIQDLQSIPEMIPDVHDGCYELVREVVSSYAAMDDLSGVTYLDLDAIYFPGMIRLSIEKKKEKVRNSSLPKSEKDRLVPIFDRVWDDACYDRYENKESADKHTVGMFGSGFMTFKGKAPDEDVFNFIQMLVDISKMNNDDDDIIFDRVENLLKNGIKGMKTASVSVVLHCLKPTVFPIMNGNMGNDSIFPALGIQINKPTDVTTYIENCRRIRDFRDTNLPFKNYRILDIMARKLPDYETDVYYPKQTDYDPKITKEQYAKYLSDGDIVPYDLLDVLYGLYLMGGEGSCKMLENAYGDTVAHYNDNAVAIAKILQKETQCKLNVQDNGSVWYWSILFVGRDAKNDEEGTFIWKFRKPLREAMADMDETGFFDNLGMVEQGPSVNDRQFDHNLILYGPPGTGKTYSTAIYAVAICERLDIDSVKAMNYDKVMARYRELLTAGRVAFTTFHQSYGYEEFIEGIKPVLSGNGSIGYSIEDGVFKDFCNRTASTITFDEAWDKLMGDLDAKGEVEITLNNKSTQKIHRAANGALASNKKNGEEYSVTISKRAVQKNWESKSENDDWYNKKIESIIEKLQKDYGLKRGPVQDSENGNKVFIIDEINRGNISKIFGELITLIETTKRLGQPEATTVTLPYSKEEFGVPSNVYILGTMNTADRSIAMMDTALRRRFSFVEMMPDTQVLKNLGIEPMTNGHETLDIPKMLSVINKRIEYLFDREHTIGHAFFTGLKNNASIEKLGEIFKKNVIPLLQEYFFEDYEKIQLVLGDNEKSSDDYKFIIEKGEKAVDIFNGTPELDAMVSYRINPEAFKHLESYIEIYEKTGATN